MSNRVTQIDWSADWNAVLDMLVILNLIVASFSTEWPSMFQRLTLITIAVAIPHCVCPSAGCLRVLIGAVLCR